MPDAREFKITGTPPEAECFRMCRRMLIGPWCNQPEEYVGYNGFVGWAGALSLLEERQPALGSLLQQPRVRLVACSAL